MWVDEMMSNASLLKYPDSTWRLQNLLCGNTNTPVWIKARVEAAWGMLDKEFLLFPSCLQTRQYLWLLGVYAISKEIDFGLLRVGFNSLRGFTNGSSIWDFFYVHCHSLCFLYTLALQQLHITSTLNTFLPISFSTHKFFHMMPETDSWRDMSPWVLLVSLNHKKHYTC